MAGSKQASRCGLWQTRDGRAENVPNSVPSLRTPRPKRLRGGIRASSQNQGLMQVVMGIDPGAANLGFGVVRVDGNRMVALDGGVVATGPEMPMERRLERVHAAVGEVMSGH